MIEIDTRLHAAYGIAKTETEAATIVFETLKERGHPTQPPPTRKQPMPGWQYLQVVKQRDDTGNLIGIDLRVIFGDEDEVFDLLGRSTAYIERTHLTMRHFNSRLVRESLAFSRPLAMHCAAAAWEDLVYNYARPLKSLRQPEVDHPTRHWRPRTPAMAAGLTDHIWSFRELLSTVSLPNT